MSRKFLKGINACQSASTFELLLE